MFSQQILSKSASTGELGGQAESGLSQWDLEPEPSPSSWRLFARYLHVAGTANTGGSDVAPCGPQAQAEAGEPQGPGPTCRMGINPHWSRCLHPLGFTSSQNSGQQGLKSSPQNVRGPTRWTRKPRAPGWGSVVSFAQHVSRPRAPWGPCVCSQGDGMSQGPLTRRAHV